MLSIPCKQNNIPHEGIQSFLYINIVMYGSVNAHESAVHIKTAAAAAAAGIYPGLSLEAEANDPETGEQFMRLLSSGVDVRTAYEVIHKDDIISGAMHYTAQKVKEKTVNDIRARGLRPQENGAQGSTAAKVVKSDPKSWTDKDMDEVIRRVAAGERIVL